MSLWQQLEQQISQHHGVRFRITERQVISGGSINNAFKVGDGHSYFFVKTNRANLAYMFEAETAGLKSLFDSSRIKVPKPIAYGVCQHESYAVLEWLDLSGRPNSEKFGQAMAALHRCEADKFGFDIDNSIGSTPQLNQWSTDWVDFWKKQRLGYQLNLIRDNGLGTRLYDVGQSLLEHCDAFFVDYQPRPSLLHGDLWSGNWAGDAHGAPVIFDPATYYGDREADLAMMELFGGPGAAFFDAYHEAYPMDPGYAQRKTFYNLYHILNHANLFGGGYALQAEHMAESLLATVR
jgi:fructosamine-3-kinase